MKRLDGPVLVLLLVLLLALSAGCRPTTPEVPAGHDDHDHEGESAETAEGEAGAAIPLDGVRGLKLVEAHRGRRPGAAPQPDRNVGLDREVRFRPVVLEAARSGIDTDQRTLAGEAPGRGQLTAALGEVGPQPRNACVFKGRRLHAPEVERRRDGRRAGGQAAAGEQDPRGSHGHLGQDTAPPALRVERVRRGRNAERSRGERERPRPPGPPGSSGRGADRNVRDFRRVTLGGNHGRRRELEGVARGRRLEARDPRRDGVQASPAGARDADGRAAAPGHVVATVQAEVVQVVVTFEGGTDPWRRRASRPAGPRPPARSAARRSAPAPTPPARGSGRGA